MNSSRFIDLDDSLSCSLGPATGPCSQPDECAPYTPTLFLTRALVFYSHLCLGIPSGLFHLLSYVFCVCYMPHCFPPFWFDGDNNARCCVQTRCTHYVAFSIPFCCRPVPYPRTPPVYHDYVLLGCDILFGRCQGEAAAASPIVSVSHFYPEYEDPPRKVGS